MKRTSCALLALAAVLLEAEVMIPAPCIEPLAARARATLRRYGYAVRVAAGEGYLGSPEAAPFDRILLTAAPETIPSALVEQLADGGFLAAPIGRDLWSQELVRVRKEGARLSTETICGVRFVPMLPGVAWRGSSR